MTDWTCGFCLNTGIRPIGLPEKPSYMSSEFWGRYSRSRRAGRWVRCQACNANFFSSLTGPDIAARLTEEQRVAVLDSPSNRGI